VSSGGGRSLSRRTSPNTACCIEARKARTVGPIATLVTATSVTSASFGDTVIAQLGSAAMARR
jgi:hypothetical protein